MTDPQTPKPSRRHRWPWFLMAAVILGIVLTILWMLGAVRRVKRIRESTTGQTATRMFAGNEPYSNHVLPAITKKRSGQQTPRRWG